MAQRLGPYTLGERIGAGGMADVYLAEGPQGVCVVKRPHAHLCASPEFVRMFLDEASLLARLSHPGIARIDDLGQVGDVYYLAMEYVPGFDLMTISLEYERHGELMAPELCARIVADVAGALHYAHEARDAEGQPLHLIHRDVTPHNILLSTTGEVKLIDFGVARASVTKHRTQAGFVKGKYPYMAPEQITGQLIDRRVDVYALGLVLYELLTNVRAIAGKNEVEQIENARWGRIRPIEQLRPNTPVPLRQIVASCLLVDPEARYPTALALKQDLEKYLLYDRKVAGREDLLRLFRVVAAESELALPALPGAAGAEGPLTGTPTDLDTPASTSDDVGFARTTPSLRTPEAAVRAAPGPLALSLELERPAPTPPLAPTLPPYAPGPAAPTVPQQEAVPPSSPMPLLAGAAVAAVVGLAAAAFLLLRPAAPAPVVAVEDAGVLTRFTFPPDEPRGGTEVGAPAAPGTASPGSATAGQGAVAGATGAASGASGATGSSGTPVAAGSAAGPASAGAAGPGGEAAAGAAGAQSPAARPATLTITSEPPAEVTVDRQALGPAPVTAQLDGGLHQVLLTSRAERYRKAVSVRLAPGEARTLHLVARKGGLTLSVAPFAAITLNGEALGSASFKELSLWEGTYLVELELSDPSLAAPIKKKLTVQVRGGETTQVNERLLP